MKRFKSIFSIFFAMVILFAAQNQALAYDKLSMMNATGRTIYYVYFTPSNDHSWGNDRLSGLWHTGETLTLATPTKKYWDLKIVFEGGRSVYWENIDTESIGYLSIKPNNSGGYKISY